MALSILVNETIICIPNPNDDLDDESPQGWCDYWNQYLETAGITVIFSPGVVEDPTMPFELMVSFGGEVKSVGIECREREAGGSDYNTLWNSTGSRSTLATSEGIQINPTGLRTIEAPPYQTIQPIDIPLVKLGAYEPIDVLNSKLDAAETVPVINSPQSVGPDGYSSMMYRLNLPGPGMISVITQPWLANQYDYADNIIINNFYDSTTPNPDKTYWGGGEYEEEGLYYGQRYSDVKTDVGGPHILELSGNVGRQNIKAVFIPTNRIDEFADHIIPFVATGALPVTINTGITPMVEGTLLNNVVKLELVSNTGSIGITLPFGPYGAYAKIFSKAGFLLFQQNVQATLCMGGETTVIVIDQGILDDMSDNTLYIKFDLLDSITSGDVIIEEV